MQDLQLSFKAPENRHEAEIPPEEAVRGYFAKIDAQKRGGITQEELVAAMSGK